MSLPNNILSPSISPNIKWRFNQLETALIAFITDLEKKLQEILPEMPVFVLHTGDLNYYFDKKFKLYEDNQELYLKVPRFVLSIEDIQPQVDQNTNKYNKLIYLFDDDSDDNGPKQYIVTARRQAYNVSINTDFVSSNFIKGLENFEIISTILGFNNAFTYEFQGSTYESIYIASNAASPEKPPMDFSSATRSVPVKTGIDLQVHLMIPKIASIKLYNSVGFDSIEFDITAHHESPPIDDYNTKIKFNQNNIE